MENNVKILKHTVALCFLMVLVNLAKAEVKLPAFFADNMVLQQQSKVKFWGFASGKKEITVKTSWDNQTYKAKADTAGNWQVFLATPSAGGPYQISIVQENKIQLQNILIGEVWICSGQSNMDMPVQGYDNLPILNSNDILLASPNPSLRLFHVERQYASTAKKDVKGSWQQADASSVRSFSAVGYQFASILQKYLGVPVGIIQTTWGGSPIEAWIEKSTVQSVLKERLATNRSIRNTVHQTPGNLFNGMVTPLIGYHIAGVIWYQGEQNRFEPDNYLSLQLAMVNLWRNRWNIGDWPFYLVQLAPMHYSKQDAPTVPLLKEAQLKLVDTLVNSGVAIAIDAGEEYNIHPSNKTIIAKRLAYLALVKTYKKDGLASEGPKYNGMLVRNDTVHVKFSKIPLGITSYGKKITQFELAGADKVFYPASASIRNKEVVVFSKDVKNPIAVRYAFSDWCIGELYSTEGLPASSFRSDNW